jgi:HSP20 family protein
MNAVSILTPRRFAARTEPDFNRFAGLDRLFDVLLDGLSLHNTGTQVESKGELHPALDIRKEDNRYSINIELPGVEEKDIQVEVSGNELSIKGEKRGESASTNKDNASQDSVYTGNRSYYSERSYGSFMRTLTLPEDVDTGAIAANYKNGVLTLLLPRKEPEQSKSRTITVNKN